MTFNADHLAVKICPDRSLLGYHAAQAAGSYLRDVIKNTGRARVIFACAPSQNEFLAALADTSVAGTIPWEKITAFHMDEYVGLAEGDPRNFRSYLQKHLLSRVNIGKFHPIHGDHPNPLEVCSYYSILLRDGPIDLICLGIGENGHIAFNDPPVADFNDRMLVKLVQLDDACRLQQVNDGCFATEEEVPRYAITLTLPVFRDALRLSVHVPGPRKASAVKAAVEGPISSACPASMLRKHREATLFLDQESASKIGCR